MMASQASKAEAMNRSVMTFGRAHSEWVKRHKSLLFIAAGVVLFVLITVFVLPLLTWYERLLLWLMCSSAIFCIWGIPNWFYGISGLLYREPKWVGTLHKDGTRLISSNRTPIITGGDDDLSQTVEKISRVFIEYENLQKKPLVTFQLPVFNEKLVLQGLIDCIREIDYPSKEIVLVDDSTDDTFEIAKKIVNGRVAIENEKEFVMIGDGITLVHRFLRKGFKAGGLNNSARWVNGEYVVLFDADWKPKPDFLNRTIPILIADKKCSYVQCRWGHLNPKDTIVSRPQELAIDNHHMCEQPVRMAWGLPFHFNGTCGVWRKRAIEECGGWDGSQLCEDLELSYRAYERGYHGVFLRDCVVDGEIPTHYKSYIRQQVRWSKGTTQALRLHLWEFLKMQKRWLARLSCINHLGYYMVFPMMLATFLFFGGLSIYFQFDWLLAPSRASGLEKGLMSAMMVMIVILTLGPYVQLIVAEVRLKKYSNLLLIPLQLVQSWSLIVPLSVAAVQGFFGWNIMTWGRTPKGGKAAEKAYPVNIPDAYTIVHFVLIIFGLYLAHGLYEAGSGVWIALPAIFVAAFTYAIVMKYIA